MNEERYANLPPTRYHVFILVAGDHERDWNWRFLGEHVSNSRADVALTEWLLEHEDTALGGEYRIRSTKDGYTVTRPHERSLVT